MDYCRCHYHHNPDVDLRALQRRALATDDPEDQARYIAARLRAGEIPPLNIEIASELGHPAAEMIVPLSLAGTRREDYVWSNYYHRFDVFQRLVDSGQHPLVVRVVAEYALGILHLFEDWIKIDDGTRKPTEIADGPRKAIEAAIRWSQEPNEANAEAATLAASELGRYWTDDDRRADTHAVWAAGSAAGAVRVPDYVPTTFSEHVASRAASSAGYSAEWAAMKPRTAPFAAEYQKQATLLAEVLLGLRVL